MTENDKLLKEARTYLYPGCQCGQASCQSSQINQLILRIDAALAEPQLSEDAISHQCIQENAFARGAEAMREMAIVAAGNNVGCTHVRCWSCESPAQRVRALPLPKDQE